MDDLGKPHARSEENMYMQEPTTKDYELRIKLFQGEPVDFKVMVHRKGHPDREYFVRGHAREMQEIPIFRAFTDEEGTLQLESSHQYFVRSQRLKAS